MASIVFERVRWRNFLSTGTSFSEMVLNDVEMKLLVGSNGSGKSTLLDAITFGLFNKPFRKITKPNLINSLNRNNCVVEIEFSTMGNHYKVVRGIKPNMLEIHVNGKMLDQEASDKDPQKMLEDVILKMNYKTFCQVVVIGSASYTPFMQLKPAERRPFIEHILDISVFSNMASSIKEEYRGVKEERNSKDYVIRSKRSSIDQMKEMIRNIESSNDGDVESLQKVIDDNKRLIISFEEKREDFLISKEWYEFLGVGDPYEIIRDEVSRIKDLINVINSKISDHERASRDSSFFIDIDKEKLKLYESSSCETCGQDIDKEFAKNKKKVLEENIDKFVTAKGVSDGEIERLKKLKGEHEDKLRELDKDELDLGARDQAIKDLEKGIKRREDTIASMKKTEEKASKEMLNTLRKAVDEMKELKAEYGLLDEEFEILSTADKLLKDNGIKSRVVEQYIPVINNLINSFLSDMNFYIKFELDDEFNETILSRHRDKFSYDNFSEGEKFRIDIALLLTWRKIAKFKNSVSTNLLVLDELFDSSLDNEGIEDFTKLLRKADDINNTIAVSHVGEKVYDLFDVVYEAKKTKNFSTIKEKVET